MSNREQKIDELTRQYLHAMSEYCDCVQISLSFMDVDHTYSKHEGFGNWYARQGLAKEFCTQDHARTVLDVEYNEFKEEDD